MGRVKVDEKKVVGEIVGLGKYDPEILVPIYQKLSGTALNVHVAFYRIILGLELLEQWENYINHFLWMKCFKTSFFQLFDICKIIVLQRKQFK